MQKRIIALLCVFLFIPNIAAAADGLSYSFENISASLTLPSGVYETVVTKDNAEQNEEFLKSFGFNSQNFVLGNALLVAHDTKNSRLLVLTAEQDEEAKQYFNINEHTPNTRASYRRLHSASDRFEAVGYYYNSVEWKNFRDVGRWLMLRYNFKQDGDVKYRGFQRKTIYNGFTINMDMRVLSGAQLKGADNTALNKVFNTLKFTNTLPLPPLPVSFDEEVTAPAETAEATFTMKGKTAGGAKLKAVVGSFSTAETKVFEDTAAKNGKYNLTITLPREDLYFMTLTVEAEGTLPLEKQYGITYRKGLMQVTIDSYPPQILTEDSYVLSGKAEKGTSLELTVNGKTSNKKTGNNGKFSFTVDTSQEGKYDINLKLSKTNYEDRVFSYQGERKLTAEQRIEKIKKASFSPSYSTLLRNMDKYDGKMLRFEGFLISAEEKSGEWIFKFATQKTGDTYKNIVLLASDSEAGYPLNTKLMVYGVLIGTTSALNDQKQEIEYPKLQLMHIE
ncbi:MAG: hypothetical protein Q4E07_05285 [Eubacteriales bacterium]|nr:hypothetical protein [Eubacteriales bacterium]